MIWFLAQAVGELFSWALMADENETAERRSVPSSFIQVWMSGSHCVSQVPDGVDMPIMPITRMAKMVVWTKEEAGRRDADSLRAPPPVGIENQASCSSRAKIWPRRAVIGSSGIKIGPSEHFLCPARSKPIGVRVASLSPESPLGPCLSWSRRHRRKKPVQRHSV